MTVHLPLFWNLSADNFLLLVYGYCIKISLLPLREASLSDFTEKLAWECELRSGRSPDKGLIKSLETHFAAFYRYLQ